MRLRRITFIVVLFLFSIGLTYRFYITDKKNETKNPVNTQEKELVVNSSNSIIKSLHENNKEKTVKNDEKNIKNNESISVVLQEIHSQMKEYDKRWDKNIQYEKIISTFFSENMFSQLEYVFIDAPTVDNEALSKQAINRVLGLKVFEYGISQKLPEIDIEAKSIIKKLNSELRQKGEVLKNQHLDLEAMIRIYLNAHPEVFDNKSNFVTLSNELGVDLSEIRRSRMTTPYSIGIVTGILTSAQSAKKFKQVETWLWES